MAATPASRSTVRLASSYLLASLAAGLLACSASGELNVVNGGAHAPQLSNLSIFPQSAALNDGAGSVSVSFGMDVLDSGADVNRLTITVLSDGAQVNQLTGNVTGPPGLTRGTLQGQLTLSTAAVTTYTLQFQVFDAAGSGSNVVKTAFPVMAGNPVPSITSLSPSSATVGGASFTLTVTGSGFLPSSTVLWNYSYLPTTYVDATTLQAQVPTYALSYAGTAQVTVSNPPPGGGTSTPQTFTIDAGPPNPVPTLTTLSPSSVEAGSASLTLTVTGSGFVGYSTVQWNGSWLPTTVVDAGTLQATVPSYYLTNVGTANITVYNPSPGGGTSSPLPFTIRRPAIAGVTAVGLQGNDLAWDPYQQKIYVSVPSASAVNPNTITVVDPFTGQLGASQFAGSEPGPIAVSDDGQYLYVGLGGASSVARLGLPSLTPDVSIPLGRDPTNGPYYARDVRVAPGAAHVLAVSLEARSTYFTSPGGVAIFDDTTERPTTVPGAKGSFGSLQWGSDATALYSASNQYGGDLYTMSVDASGVALTHDWSAAFNFYGTRIHFDPGTGLVYGDDGHAVEPATGLAVGTFPLSTLYSALMTPDSSLDSAFFAGRTGYGSSPELRAYDLHRYVQTRSLSLPYVSDPAGRIVRFGPDGLAFLAGKEVILARGPIVLPVSAAANPAPAVTSLTPPSAAAGGANFKLVVTGSGFVPGSVVQWNGSDRSTTFVSSTQIVAFVPASDVAAAGSPEVTVTSPAPGGGTSSAVTFTVNP